MTKTSNRQSKKAVSSTKVEHVDVKPEQVRINKFYLLYELRFKPIESTDDEIGKMMDERFEYHDKFKYYLIKNGIDINHEHFPPITSTK